MVDETLAGHYQIVDRLGGGGFGQTFLARDNHLPGTPLCVVKQLKPKDRDPQALEIAKRLFEREAKILYKLGNLHEQIPRLMAHFEQDGEFYLVQEYIEGQSLDTEIIPGKQLSEADVIALVCDILQVLSFVHQQNVIHRDIKPSNLIRRKRDNKIVLIDFGAVKEVRCQAAPNASGESTLTVAVGSLGYMPNEQLAGQPHFSSDIYAVGMLCLQALTGVEPKVLPKDTQTGEYSCALLSSDRSTAWHRIAISPNFAVILEKMVRYDYRQRYENATVALHEIEQLIGWGTTIAISRPSHPQPDRQTRESVNLTEPQSDRQTRRLVNPTNPYGQIGLDSPSYADRLLRLVRTRRRAIGLAGLGGAGLLAALALRSFQESPQGRAPQPTSAPLPSEQPNGLPLQRMEFDVVTVDALGRKATSRQSAQFFTEDLGNKINLMMVAIPGGRLLMGSPDTEAQRKSQESPQHSVAIAPLFISKYAIDQTKWRSIAAFPKIDRNLPSDPSEFKGAELPVENISWLEAIEFCARLSKYTGRTYRLPSEAEWEYACRAGTSTPFHLGETIATDLANYYGLYTYGSGSKGEFRGKTVDVDEFKANAFGLYQMHGNVWEWCADYWYDSYQNAPSDGSARLGDSNNFKRLLRGGSWGNSPSECRSASRFKAPLDYRGHDVGFRVVCMEA